MLQFFKSIFSGTGEALPQASVPDGTRVYAIGDVHGRLDLFEALIDAVEADDSASRAADTSVILLGDLVDRGPASAQVLERARQWQAARSVRILCGNHEEMFLSSFDSTNMMRHFLRHGGTETLLSYGINPKKISKGTVEEVQEMMRAAVPRSEIDYIAGFEDMIRIGDYVFVHAGIDPEVALEDQRRQDLRWIREPFLSHAGVSGTVVVHGHTISEEPVERANRIGIDTGAYSSGRLTALVLEGSTRRFIEAAQGEDGAISTSERGAVAG